MAQHFLLSSAARTLSLKSIYAQGEEAAYQHFGRLRWPETNGAPVCPRCRFEEAYKIGTRRKCKCKACHHQFSVTSGTIFASHKLAFMDLLGAIALVANAAKGMSALQLARTIGVSYKTAFVLIHKLRAGETPPLKPSRKQHHGCNRGHSSQRGRVVTLEEMPEVEMEEPLPLP